MVQNMSEPRLHMRSRLQDICCRSMKSKLLETLDIAIEILHIYIHIYIYIHILTTFTSMLYLEQLIV